MAVTGTAICCYVGLGSNLDDPVAQIETALCELHSLPATAGVRVSSFYNSQPMGPANQPDYVNAVVELTTGISAEELLDEMLKIETGHGRLRLAQSSQKNGPRTLDLDLLLYGDLLLDLPGLTVPHPGLHQRDFVVLPLLEIAPNLTIPGLGRLSDYRQQSVDHGAIRGTTPNWQP